MEFIEGITVNDRLKSHGGFTVEAANSVIAQLSSALHHAHQEARVVHRDLKPSNVMIDAFDRVVLLDFGLGIFIEEDIISRITKTGEQAVASLCTAPELIKNPRLVDPSSDIYSLGALWFTLLTGRPPGGRRIEALLDGHHNFQDADKQLLLRCLSEPEERPS